MPRTVTFHQPTQKTQCHQISVLNLHFHAVIDDWSYLLWYRHFNFFPRNTNQILGTGNNRAVIYIHNYRSIQWTYFLKNHQQSFTLTTQYTKVNKYFQHHCNTRRSTLVTTSQLTTIYKPAEIHTDTFTTKCISCSHTCCSLTSSIFTLSHCWAPESLIALHMTSGINE